MLVFVFIVPHLCGAIGPCKVTSAADFTPGLPRAGSLATLFCSGLTGLNGGLIVPEDIPRPRSVAGIAVSVAGVAAPILAVADFGSYQQVNFQVPWESASARPLMVIQGGETLEMVDGLDRVVWSVFFRTSTGGAVAQHAADYSLVTLENPGRPGEWIIVYGTDLGPLPNRPETGMPAPFDPLAPVTNPAELYSLRLSVQNRQDSLERWAGLAPGFIGVYQVNVRIPSDFPAGQASLRAIRLKFCGFFWTPGCGRGWIEESGSAVTVPIGP